jgi:acetolactate synthase small subunit
MQTFHLRYRNTQGVLMRILNAVSRRGLDFNSLQAEPVQDHHQVTLLLEVTPKQVGQLNREWYSIVDVLEVRSTAGQQGNEQAEWTPLPPGTAGVPQQSSRAALA